MQTLYEIAEKKQLQVQQSEEAKKELEYKVEKVMKEQSERYERVIEILRDQLASTQEEKEEQMRLFIFQQSLQRVAQTAQYAVASLDDGDGCILS
ncbi:hypothetical protein EB796_001274 [Bugula neritina]|uniref:Uncharacterized protein n=1 Tax=Bugula neritina TaxID=10212 RepID=A0A7J7KQG2_BUGNE|nr:hypothetical protein EB796_001274 [Bugula neritina]